jgi:hypothetical protein
MTIGMVARVQVGSGRCVRAHESLLNIPTRATRSLTVPPTRLSAP